MAKAKRLSENLEIQRRTTLPLALNVPDREEANMYSDSEDERLAGFGEEGVDLSELMDMDETPVTEPNSDRPTVEHREMLKTLRKGLGLDYAAQRAKLKEEVKSIAPAKKESAFGVSVEGASKVDLSELMAASTFSKETKKGLEKLERSERRLEAEDSKYAKIKAERGVAYEDTKAILSEWLPTVQSMRQADSLVFPLPEQATKREKATTSGATTSFSPTTDLEKAVFGLLEESGVTEARLQEAEDLATKKLSSEEIRARHQQIARLRSLSFYQEQKNKRQAKIKSKKYRKILKKAREKNEMTLAELKELDPEAYAEELEKLDKARALERVGIKHGHMGKWAKHALRSKDPHTMQAVRDHLEHGRMLRKRMATDRDGEEDSDYDIDSDVSSIHSSDLESEKEGDFDDEAGEPGDIIDIHGNVVKLKSKKKNSKNGEDDEGDEEKGVFGMQFMKRAAAKTQSRHDTLMAEMDQEIDERRRQLKAQRRKAKDDFDASGERIKADSDSDSDIKEKTTSKHNDSDDDEGATKAVTETSRPGRKTVLASASQVSASALARQSLYDSDNDEGFDGSSMLISRTQGFASSIKGKLTVQAAPHKTKTVQHVEHEDDGENSDDLDQDLKSDDENATSESGAHSFRLNSKDVKSVLEASSKTTTAHQPAKSKNKVKQEEIKIPAKKPSLNEDGLLIGSSIATTGKSKTKSHFEEDEDQDETIISILPKGASVASKRASTVDKEEDNPWMMVEEDDEGLVIAGTKKPTTSKLPAPKSKSKSGGAKSVKTEEEEDNPWMMVEEGDEGLVIPGTKRNTAKSPAAASKPSAAKSKGKKSEDKVAVDLERVQKKLAAEEARRDGVVFNLSAASATSKSQKELIERAFAGDHLTEKDVAAEKESMVEAANEVESEYATLTLPGWGEWAGNGVKPSARRQRVLKEMEAKKAERSAEIMAQRADSKLKHAIISDKTHSKNFTLYQAASVPFEFKDNPALYEAAMRQPMGKEWNVRETHSKLVKPKVTVRRGHVIEPIQKKTQGIQRR